MGKIAEPVITNLKNHLLIATAELNGSFFEKAVIYIANHGPEGSMGFVINQPMNKIKFADIARSMGIEDMLAQGRANPIVFRGGPVENTRGFVLHSPDYTLPSTVTLTPALALSAQADIVGDIAHGRGPAQTTFCLGYAGWKENQLETELHTNSWLIAPATPEILFTIPPQQRYSAATRILGLNTLNFSTDTIGLA